MWREDIHAAAVTLAAAVLLLGGSAFVYAQRAVIRGREVALDSLAERLRKAMLGR